VADGIFVVLEGIDGAGTTTQARLLQERLAAELGRCLLTREPSDGPIGMLIRQVLRGRLGGYPGSDGDAAFDRASLALLFAADRLDHLAAEIAPALAQGSPVVCDRYVLSSLAYQSLDLDPAWVAEINARARQPDLTLLLDVPPGDALARVHATRAATELFEEREILEQVTRNYQRFAEQDRERTTRLDGRGPVDQVQRLVWDAVEKSLADRLRVR